VTIRYDRAGYLSPQRLAHGAACSAFTFHHSTRLMLACIELAEMLMAGHSTRLMLAHGRPFTFHFSPFTLLRYLAWL
jgi:hypothetical protein